MDACENEELIVTGSLDEPLYIVNNLLKIMVLL